jgi:hypothetical protein
MTFLDDLRGYRISAASAYHQYLLDQRSGLDRVFTFFEGRDDSSFYAGFVVRFTGTAEAVFTYACGSRDEVVETFEKVRRNPGLTNRTLFFIDRDLSSILAEDLPEDERLYITDFYSIENHMVSPTTLKRFWDDILSAAANQYQFGRIQGTFEEALYEFYSLILPISVWIIFMRRSRLDANLNNINLSRLMQFDSSCHPLETTPGRTLAEAARMAGANTPPEYRAHINPISREIEDLHPKSYVRGKFEMWFFVEFVKALISSMDQDMRGRGLRLRIRTPLNHSNAVEVLGPRTDIPSSLEKFLIANLGNNKQGAFRFIRRAIGALTRKVIDSF